MRFRAVSRNLYGPLLWISSVQYLIAQLIVISAWTVPHSWANNFISDLGNTECGIYAGLPVCSPLHPLMNVSFVVFGMTMSMGAWLLWRHFQRTTWTTIGFGLMILAGFGTVLVGLFPENTISPMHTLGATLGLGVGNLSVLLIGLGLRSINLVMRWFTIASAVVSLAAFALFVTDTYLGLGRGGMERLVSYPFTVWMVTFGVYTFYKVRKSPNA